MVETIQTLENAGLSKTEAKVYVTLLRTGPASVTEIANRCGMHRPSVYDILRALEKKSLSSRMGCGRGRRFIAADPQILKILHEQKEQEITEVIKLLQTETILLNNTEDIIEVHQGHENLKRTLLYLKSKDETIKYYGARPQECCPARHISRMITDCTDSSAPKTQKGNTTMLLTENNALLIRWSPLTFVWIKDRSMTRMLETFMNASDRNKLNACESHR